MTLACFAQQTVKPVHLPQMHYFPLSDIRLLDSEFKHIQDMTHSYLLTLEPDRLCSWFRREAGLTPQAQPYPGWESNYGYIIPGHILGFYLSSMSMMYETTGDTEIIPIPEELTKNKNRLTVKFQARPGNTAGGIFDIRLIAPRRLFM